MKQLIASLFAILYTFSYSQEQPTAEIFIKNEQGTVIKEMELFIENISNPKEHYKIRSDNTGAISIPIKKEGQYMLLGVYSNYEPVDTLVTFYDRPIVITLKKVNELEAVVIQSDKRLMTVKKGKFVVNTENETLKNLPNAWEALSNSPMITTSDGGGISLGSKSATIFVNNKELLIYGEELKGYLENIPVEDVKSFELNTNPNASYGSQIQSAIHIKLNKTAQKTTQTSFRSLNGIRRKFYNLNSIGYKLHTSGIRLDNRITSKASERYYTNTIHQGSESLNSTADQENESVSATINMDMDLSERHWIDIFARYKYGDTEGNSETLGNSTTIFSETQNNATRILGNLLYLFTINDSTKIDIRGDYAYSRGEQKNRIRFGNVGTPRDYDQFIPEKTPIIRWASNFIRDTEKGGYAVGIKYASVQVTNNNRQEQAESATIFGNFSYSEQVYAGYFNKEFAWKKNFLSIGIRGELTDIRTDFINQANQTINERFDYFNLIPNATFTFVTEKEASYTLGITSSVTRPSYDLLNPFTTYESDILEFEGDLRLSPQQQYTIELGYNYKRHGLLLQAAYLDNFISTYIKNEDGQLISTYSNFEDVYFLAANYSFRKKINSYWRYTINSGLVYPIINDKRFELDVTSPSINVLASNSFKISDQWRYNLNLRYRSAYSDGFFKHRASGSVYTSITYRLKKPNLYASLFANDIFRTDVSGIEVLLPEISYKTKGYDDVFRVGINLVYKIGKKIKSSKKATKEGFDEFDRIK